MFMNPLQKSGRTLSPNILKNLPARQPRHGQFLERTGAPNFLYHHAANWRRNKLALVNVLPGNAGRIKREKYHEKTTITMPNTCSKPVPDAGDELRSPSAQAANLDCDAHQRRGRQ
jgi:hypothetical protein